MNVVADVKHSDIRELEQLLAHGQANSCTALINLVSGAVLSRGKGNEVHKPIDDKMLAVFGQSVFASERVSDAKRDQVHKLCAGLGGIAAVGILMGESSLFLSRLPASSRILCLVILNGESSASASGTVVHARAIRSRLAPGKITDMHSEVQRQAVRSYSIWGRFINAITSRFAGSVSPKAPAQGFLREELADEKQVMAGDLFDLKTGAHLDYYRHARLEGMKVTDAKATSATLADLFDGRLDIRLILEHFGFAGTPYGKVQVQIGDRDFYWLRVPFFPAMQIPFDTDSALLLYKETRPSPALDWTALDHVGLNLLRLRIGSLLAGGMKTEMFPFPQTQIEFQGIINRLAELPNDDLTGRLDIGGFAAHSVEIDEVTQRCQECIYYLPHRKWCDLPELPVPVEADWWCRLWKI